MRRSTVAIECSSRRSPTAAGVPSLWLLSALVSALVLAAASGSANAQQKEPAAASHRSPPGFNLAQGVRLLVQADAGGAKFDPVSLTGMR